MMQPETPETKKKSFLESLPRLGRASQLILLVGVFLVIFIPLWIVYQQQPEKQAALQGTLTNLQKILAVEQTPKARFEAELAQVTAETATAEAVFPRPNQSPEIIDNLLELANVNDLYVTETKVSSSTAAGAIGPTLTIELTLKGQIPNFQNFLLALNDRLPTSQIKMVNISMEG
jgi:hypothetical protein